MILSSSESRTNAPDSTTYTNFMEHLLSKNIQICLAG